MIRRLWQAFASTRFERTLTDCMQSRNSRNSVELNEIFSTESQPAKLPFDHWTDTALSTSVSDPEVTNTQWQL